MSSTLSTGTKILIGFGTVMFCVIVAVCIQALRITETKTEFIASGKLIVGLQMNSVDKDRDKDKALPLNLVGTQLEIIESGELRRRALERMRSEHPELKEIDVEIRATQTKGSNIINVAATAEEPKFTRVFLDTLLVEFIAFRREMIDKTTGSAMNRVIEEVLSREKNAKEKRDALAEFTQGDDPRLSELEHDRLARKVSSLRGEIEDLRRSDPDGTKLKETQAFLTESEKQLTGVAERNMNAAQLKEAFEASNRDYQDWKKQLERVDGGFTQDDVAIMERPMVAVECEPDLVSPLMVAVGVGAIFGGVLAAIILALMGKPLSSLSPPPLPPA